MKNIFKISLFAFLALGLFSCEEDSDTLTGNKNTGGLLTVQKTNIAYVVGNGDTFQYATDLSAFQGREKVKTIEVYNQFTNVDGDVSNKVLLTTLTLPNNQQLETTNLSVTYPQLIAGLTINGMALPTSDSGLNIGDYWTLSYVTTSSDGGVTENAAKTKVSVGTRFAGTYRVVEGQYWRIGVHRTDINWDDLEVVIESVDATTYKKVKYAGPFDGNEFYFTIDASDNVLVPTTYNGNTQLLNGAPATNCTENPGDLTNACPYGTISNTVVRDNVNGKDRIYMTYGYLAGSGPREFYEILEKVN